MILPRLDQRHREPELMDEPGLSVDRHHKALHALQRVNLLSGSASRIWREVRRLHRTVRGRPIRVLDIACGAGDVAVAVAKRAGRAGIRVEMSGSDVSETALAHARTVSQHAAVSVDFFQSDATDSIPPDYDLLCNSLFLHHLDESDGVRLIAAMAAAAPVMLVQDLLRSRVGYVLAWGVLRAISRSDVAQTDGPLSVRAAYTLPEMQVLVKRANLTGVSLRRCWPERFELVWRRP